MRRCPGRHERERLGNLAGCTAYCVEAKMSAEQQVTDATEAEVALARAEQDPTSGTMEEPVTSERPRAKRKSSEDAQATSLNTPRIRQVEREIQTHQDKAKKA